MAKTHSHQKSVSICLHDHIIPKGLQIKTQPCVPKSPCRELVSRLQKDWTRIIERTCRDFITGLKLYHRGCAYHFGHRADDLEASIKARFGRTRMRLIRKEAKATYEHQNFHLRERRHNKLIKLCSRPNSSLLEVVGGASNCHNSSLKIVGGASNCCNSSSLDIVSGASVSLD